MEAFECSGLWWLPDAPGEQVVGLLKYSDGDGFTLSIPFGHLGGMKHMAGRVNRTESTPLVYGVLQTGKHVTLVDLLMTHMTMNMPGAGSEEYYAGLGFVGSVQAQPNPELNRARLAFTYLRDWVVEHPCVSRLAVEEGKLGRSVDYHYEAPEPEKVAAGEGWTALIVHTASVPVASLTGFALTHDVEIELRFDHAIPFEQLSTEFVGPLWQFLVFCVDRAVDTTGLRIRDPGSGDWMDVGRHQSVSGLPEKILMPSFMLLSRPQLGERLAAVLGTWLAIADDERRAVSLLTGLMSERGIPGDLRFLVAAQALEALARVEAKETELKPEEFERRVKVAVDSIAESKVRKWVARKLKYANDRSAPDLLRDLVANIGEYAAKVAPDQKSLLDDVRDNRNFYTHRDPRRAKRILEGEPLYTLTQALILLLKAATLRRLGFSSEETSAIMEDCQGALQWRFRTAKQYAVKDSA
jgi:hypothetical protein